MKYQIFQKRTTTKDYKQVFIDFNKSLKLINDKLALINSTIARIDELVSPAHVHVFLHNQEADIYELTITTKQGLLSPSLHFKSEGIIQWLRLNEKPFILSSKPEFASVYSANDLFLLPLLDCQVVFPLRVLNTIKGLVLLGAKKRKNTKYSADEIDLINILLDNAAIAIENISFYDEQKDRLKKMYRADKLAVIGQLAAGAAHEIRNPLTSIRSTIQYIKKDIHTREKQTMVANVINEVDRINEIISGLLSFSRQSEPTMKQVNLKMLLQQVISLLSNTTVNKSISITLEYLSPNENIIADGDQLKQVFLNILLNAIEAADTPGEITILVWLKKTNDVLLENMYTIIIKDHGKGISAEDLEKVFDPFFTTKDEGTGLGLSICYGIIHKHNGEIEIKSEVNKGTEVVIKLPTKPLSYEI